MTDPDDTGSAAAPAVLRISADPSPDLAPIVESAEISAVHHAWAEMHTGEVSRAPLEQPGGFLQPGGVRARVRSRVVTAATEAARSSRHDDRALIGDLIRAMDALARRADELAARISHLEGLSREIVSVLGEDIVAVRVALAAGSHALTPAPRAGGGAKGVDGPGG